LNWRWPASTSSAEAALADTAIAARALAVTIINSFIIRNVLKPFVFVPVSVQSSRDEPVNGSAAQWFGANKRRSLRRLFRYTESSQSQHWLREVPKRYQCRS
jgi:hypothetical protein